MTVRSPLLASWARHLGWLERRLARCRRASWFLGWLERRLACRWRASWLLGWLERWLGCWFVGRIVGWVARRRSVRRPLGWRRQGDECLVGGGWTGDDVSTIHWHGQTLESSLSVRVSAGAAAGDAAVLTKELAVAAFV